MTTRTGPSQTGNPAHDYVPYDSSRDYEGAETVVNEEFRYINRRRAWLKARREGTTGAPAPEESSATRPDNLIGLALSGGGIRSASFSLGVMQALAQKDALEKIDYLSTVSGGGYAGSSLTWLLHRQWKDDQGELIPMGLSRDDLAFGTRWRTKGEKSAQETGNRGPSRRSVLRHLRQNASYLKPGHGITLGSLVAVVLRGTFISMSIYLSCLIILFLLLNHFQLLSETQFNILKIGTIFLYLFAFSSVAYALSTRFVAGEYKGRRLFESTVKWLLYGALAAYGLVLLPLLQIGIGKVFAYFQVSITSKENFTGFLGFISSIGGIVSGLVTFLKSRKSTASGESGMALAAGASILLLFGLNLIAFSVAGHLERPTDSWPIPVPLFVMLILIVFAVAGWTNINYISIHRYYRDRLMETFMPDVTKVVKSAGYEPEAATLADRAFLYEMCPGDYPLAPYHLINTSMIIVESRIAKFHGRGGDNFILSPKYCGSNATGWRSTRDFMHGQMTLPTAMAISGAAVNPGAGCGGEGVTRQPLVSMLMTFLNIRLGYSAPHPNPDKRHRFGMRPNFIYPGFRDLFLRWKIRDDSGIIQLSDGGHFENLGIYELLRRRLKLIIVVDAGADPKYTFSDLANAMEKALVDFGTFVHICGEELAPLIPPQKGSALSESLAERGYLVADISYNITSGDQQNGKLVYLTTTFTKNLTADLHGYRNAHPEFPDEPTGDQFFDEKQFEAYRELGFQLTYQMLEDFEQVDADNMTINTFNLLGITRDAKDSSGKDATTEKCSKPE